jgi:hypothetical protein
MKKLTIATIVTAVVFLVLAAFPSWAAEGPREVKEKPPADNSGRVTIQQAINLQTALRNLDGHLVIVKLNGQDGTVMVPWMFDNGRLRKRIADDLSIIDGAVKVAEEARKAIFREVAAKFKVEPDAKSGAQELKAGTPERVEYDKQVEELMSAPAAGTQDLAKIKVSELKLDKNEIAVTALEALGPILMDDEK